MVGPYEKARVCKTCNQTTIVSICKQCQSPFCSLHGIPHDQSRLLQAKLLSPKEEESILIMEEARHAIAVLLKGLSSFEAQCSAYCKDCFHQTFQRRMGRIKIQLCGGLLFFLAFAGIFASSLLATTMYTCVSGDLYGSLYMNCGIPSQNVSMPQFVTYTRFKLNSTDCSTTVFQNPRAPLSFMAKSMVCKCNEPYTFSNLEGGCAIRRCDLRTHYRTSRGQCYLKKVELFEEEQGGTGCPYYTRYWPRLNTCQVVLCPRHYLRVKGGDCIHCPLYQDTFTNKCESSRHNSRRVKGSLHYLELYQQPGSGFTFWCKKDDQGKQITFYDELGQLQCIEPKLLPFYNDQRPCKDSEMLMADYIGCTACPPFLTYDFSLKKCVEPFCPNLNIIILPSGDCYTCSSPTKYASEDKRTCVETAPSSY